MTALTPELAAWLLSLKEGASYALFFCLLILLVYNWLVKADPAAFLRGMLNNRKRHLEAMADMKLLTEHSHTLVARELRQKVNHRLTGLADHRLQDACMDLCVRFNLLGSYFSPWRSWLDEEQGRITFDWRWYQTMRNLSIASILTITALLCALTWAFMRRFGTDDVAVFMILNIAVWWAPLLILLTVPGQAMTKSMLSYVERYNALFAPETRQQEDASGPDSPLS